MPDLRRRRLESGDCGVGIDFKDANKAIERSGGSYETGRMSSNRDDAEAVAGVGPLQLELVGLPELDGLVEGAGEEDGGAIVGGRNPSRRPYRLVVGIFNGFETREFHLLRCVVSVFGVTRSRALGRRIIISQRNKKEKTKIIIIIVKKI